MTVIHGVFQLSQPVRVLLTTLAMIIAVTGLAASVGQRSVGQSLVSVLLFGGGLFSVRHQVDRGSLGEEEVMRFLVNAARVQSRANLPE